MSVQARPVVHAQPRVAAARAVDRRRRELLLTVFAAGAGTVLVGVLAGSGLPLVLVAMMLLAPAVLIGTLLRPELGLLALVFTVFSHLSDVAVAKHGTPSLLQPYLLLLLVSLAAHSVRRGALPSGLGTPAALLVTYGVVQALSAFQARDPEGANLALNVYVRDVVVALLVVALLRTARDLERVLWVLVLTGGLLAGLGILQYVTGSFGTDFGGFAQASVKNISGSNEDYRISGPIADPNHWAQALLVVVPIAVGRARSSPNALARAVAGGAFGMSLLAIVFTFSRGALLALAMLAVVVVWQRPPPAWAFGAAAVLLALVLQALPPGYTDRLGQLIDALPVVGSGQTSEASLSGRVSALRAAQDMALDNPVLGVGVGQFQENYRDYALGLGVDTVEGGLEPHNMYLEVASETGYFGVVAWAAVVGVALHRLGRGRRILHRAERHRESELLGDLQLGLFGYLISGLFVHNAYPRLFWLLIGAAFAAPAVVRSVLDTVPAHRAEAST